MRSFLPIALFILLATAVSAIDFNAEVFPDSRTIQTNESVSFDLILTHKTEMNENFEVYSPDVQWDLTLDIEERLLTVHQGEEKAARVILRPLNLNPGTYVVPIHVRLSGKDQLKKTYVLVSLLTPGMKLGEYLPALRVTPSIQESVDPRQDVAVKVLIENLNRKNLSDVSVKVRGNLVNADIKTTLTGLEKKELKITKKLDPLTAPQKDTLKISVIANQERSYQFDGKLLDYQVMSYGEVAFSDLESQKELLKEIKTYTLTNNGNIAKESNYRIERTFSRRLFSSFKPEPKVVSNSYQWDFRLEPRQNYIIVETTNYRPLVYVLLIALVAILAYLYFRSPLIVAKSAMIVATREAGISELKVIIQLKNRGRNPVKNVVVLDRVPRIAEIVKDSELGTIKPVHTLVNEKRGTLLKWELSEVEAGEERIISYKMRSSLSILGGLRLPVAVARCTGLAGKEHKTTSNLMQIGFGEKL